ncbi:MAG: anti-sigma factor [Gemmatimonadaceae bacterium]|nr:anti-sigma factor [Acetobacteraceae bacterium]
MMEQTPDPVGEDDLQAFVDGQLGAERHAVIEDYIARHPEAAARVQDYVAQRLLLREALQPKLDEPIPMRLHTVALKTDRAQRWPRLGALAASLALAVMSGGAAGWLVRGQPERAAVQVAAPRTQIAMAAHKVFVADRGRPVEVRADARDQLVQWLSTRMQAQILIPDLSGLGLRFMGGRLLPSSAGPAAQLMYDDDTGTRVTLFVESNAGGGTQADQFVTNDQVEALSWADRRFAYTLAAAGRRDQLAQAGDLVKRQLPVDQSL